MMEIRLHVHVSFQLTHVTSQGAKPAIRFIIRFCLSLPMACEHVTKVGDITPCTSLSNAFLEIACVRLSWQDPAGLAC